VLALCCWLLGFGVLANCGVTSTGELLSQPTTAARRTATVVPTRPAEATPQTRRTPTPARQQSLSGLPTVSPDDLPREARETLALIEQNGPFPYTKDGSVFQNRERILPGKPRGYYREYTVETPGSDDRGARRIVTGEEGEIYYTDDHYESFVQVIP
jgi:ribonuclease T1